MSSRWVACAAVLLAACHSRVPASISPPVPVAAAAELGFDSTRLAAVAAYVASQVDSAFPGAVVAVGRHGRLALLAAAGHYGTDDPRPVDPQTIYDLASLTKVIGLTTACMTLVAEGRLDLDAPVRAYVPEFRGPDKERVTIRHLLTHASGLPAWRPLFREARDRRTALALVDTTPLDSVPGSHFVYSDLGAILLMQVVERITGERIDHYLTRRVFEPLGMTSTRYLPPGSWRDRLAPTEIDTAFRHRLIRGEVHDENAGRMGGVSGHAGLFSTAPDLARFAAWLLDTYGREQGARSSSLTASDTHPAPCSALCVSSDVVVQFTRRQGIPPGSTRALGWDTPSDSGYSSAGKKLSRASFGHTGFTGTSIWMDPERDLFVILLTNRVNPTRANTKILQVRATVADLVADALLPLRP
ncbi:MAG TPA: serine hydrolase domain-containing protein [Gemmatimonadales bacterium]|nr:serine hydrolase domain-containing protein [Gemmatimonadales bacterium]